MRMHLATHKDRRWLCRLATVLAVLAGVGLHHRIASAQSQSCNCVSDAGEPCDCDPEWDTPPNPPPPPDPESESQPAPASTTSDSDSFWHDIYKDDCGSGKDRALLYDDCDYDDRYAAITPSLVFGPVWGSTLPPFPAAAPSTVLTSAPWVPGSGSNLGSQLRPAGPGVGRAPVYEQIGFALGGRTDDLQLGLGTSVLIAHGASGFLVQGTVDFQKRFAWLNPYAGLAMGGGLVSYDKQVPGSPGDSDCYTTEDGDVDCSPSSIDAGIVYLAARAGLRVFVVPWVAVGVEGQRSLLGTQKLESVAVTVDVDIPVAPAD
jgi:hypothetical protein